MSELQSQYEAELHDGRIEAFTATDNLAAYDHAVSLSGGLLILIHVMDDQLHWAEIYNDVWPDPMAKL